jgi:shikimate dehydrogenase
MDAHTDLYWLLGHPVKQTVSPGLFSRAFAQTKVNAAMLAIDVPPAKLEHAIELFRHASNVRGCLLTVPHKLPALHYMDAVSQRSQALGLVNIIRKTQAGLEGDALDGQGFIGALAQHGHRLSGQRILIIGCGGAGAASAWDALKSGVFQVGLIDSDPTRVQQLVATLGQHFSPERVKQLENAAGDWPIVLNASPLGMREGDALPMPLDQLSSDAVLIDATTPPKPSRWLSLASARGHAVIHGPDFTRGQVQAMADYWNLSQVIQLALGAI